MNTVFVYPGQFYTTNKEERVATILGSCVSIVLYDSVNKVGGLNHYLLSKLPDGERPSPRYGSVAIPALIKSVLEKGAERTYLKACVFGGGNVLTGVKIGEGVGKKNIDMAFAMLEQEGIQVIKQDVGGNESRKISFLTSTFEVTSSKSSDKTSLTDGAFTFKKVEDKRPVRVGVVDDSLTVRNILSKIFRERGLEVVGVAAHAYEAREMIVKHKPEVITLDIEMPHMSGVAFLEKLMKHQPMPVVVVSSLKEESQAAMKALEFGAIEFVNKISQFNPQVLRDLAEMLVGKVRAAATVTEFKKIEDRVERKAVATAKGASTDFHQKSEVKLIVIGGNIGSQNQLKTLLKGLQHDSPPIVIANSMLAPLVPGFIENMSSEVSVELKIPESSSALHMGEVYLIPDGFHGVIADGGRQLKLQEGPPVGGARPSATTLFKSAAQEGRGSILGMLTSGFGSDGVAGLEDIQKKGGTTVVINPSQCESPYITQNAIESGIVDKILNVEEIAEYILDIRSARAA